jgi:uncharacterized protein YegL
MHSVFALSLLGAGLSCAGEDPSAGGISTLPVTPTAGGGTGSAAGAGGTTGALPPSAGGGAATLGGGGTPGSGLAGAGGTAGIVTGPGGKVCATQVINAYGTVPDMLIVLDRSQSMMLYNRWQPSKQAVKTITTEFEGLLAFGLEYFPGATATDVDVVSAILGGAAAMCAGGEKLDVPMMLRNAQAIGQNLDRTMTKGLTPTGAALRAAAGILGDRSPQLDTVIKPGYVLLVTDGDPMCDQQLSVTGGPDTMQQDEARAAVKALKDKGIPTYVIGYQIDAARQAIMNEMAMLGGTMKYFAAESSDQIVGAFRQITKDVIKCTFELKPTDNKPIDPKYVRIQIDQASIPLNATDGWVINGNTITLQGGSCATLKDGKGHNLNAQVECTEVILN